MHDPLTVAHEIKSPFRKKPDKFWPKGYRTTIITIWHKDPETDGTDDSCGWFPRSRHGNNEMLKKIEKRFEFDWDRTYKETEGKVHAMGYFHPEGQPNFTVPSIIINLFFLAAFEMMGRGKAYKFMQKNLFDILMFAENPTDSLHNFCIQRFGPVKRKERIQEAASSIYGYILRKIRPWYKHPKWHMHHWQVQVMPLLQFKRWAFSKCSKCGKGFKWGYAPITTSWNSTGPMWFKSEENSSHQEC